MATPSPSARHATQLITRIAEGDAAAADELAPMVYDELRALAGRLLQGERRNHTLQATALVHEAYVRLADVDSIDWRGKAHFAALAARAMRKVLVDHAKRKRSKKRGGGWRRITMQGLFAGDGGHHLEVMAVDEALTRFGQKHPRQAEIVELRFFADMTGKEIAEIMGVSRRMVVKDLTMAQAWLLREMDRGTGTQTS